MLHPGPRAGPEKDCGCGLVRRAMAERCETPGLLSVSDRAARRRLSEV